MELFSVFLRLALTSLVLINCTIAAESPSSLPPSSSSSSSFSAETEKKSPGENDCPSVPDGFLNSLMEVSKVLLHQERSSPDASSSPGQSHEGGTGQLSFREGVEGLSSGRSINQRLLLSLWESEEEKLQLIRELRQTKEELLQLKEKVETEKEEQEGDEKEPPQSRLFCPPPPSPPHPLQHLPQGPPSSHHDLITNEGLEKMKEDLIDTIMMLTNKIESNHISGRPEGQKEGWPPKESCYSLFQYENVKESGVYTIYPQNASLPEGKRVWCDMGEGDDEFNQGDGGWTVILNRMPLPTQVNFTRNWEEYRRGFGYPETEYWIGNEVLHLLTTSDKPQSLLVQMRDWDNVTKFAYYEEFHVADEGDKFRLKVGKYSSSSTAQDSLERHNGMQFTSYDRDNDIWSKNCAHITRGGFWFRECSQTTPTSPISRKDINPFKMRWRGFYGDGTTLMTMKMKIKPLVKEVVGQLSSFAVVFK